jgi:hypothetical protein
LIPASNTDRQSLRHENARPIKHRRYYLNPS